MKPYSLLIFLSLLIISSCTLSSLRSSDITLLENLRKSEFGKTLLKSIQIQVKAHGRSHSPINSILDLVNKIRTQIESEQAAAQSTYESQKSDCSDSTSALEADIASSQQTLDDNNKTIITLQNQLSGYNSDLNAAQQLQDSQEEQISQLDDIRQNETAQYQDDVAQINAMIASLQEGKQILQSLLASNSTAGSFFQKNNILNKPSKEDLRRVISLMESPKNGYLKLGTILLEMVVKQEGEVDQDLLNKVLDLIDSLVQQLLDSRTTKANAEQEREDTYNQEKTNLQSSLLVISSNINSIQSNIKAINDQLLTLNQDNINLQTKISTDEDNLDDEEQECSDYYHTYMTESQNRSNELEILDKLTNIFETQFDKVDDYIRTLTF